MSINYLFLFKKKLKFGRDFIRVISISSMILFELFNFLLKFEKFNQEGMSSRFYSDSKIEILKRKSY